MQITTKNFSYFIDFDPYKDEFFLDKSSNYKLEVLQKFIDLKLEYLAIRYINGNKYLTFYYYLEVAGIAFIT